MKAKKQQRKLQPPDAKMQEDSQSKARPKRTKKATAKEKGGFALSAKTEKFKQEQHLQIDTQELADGKMDQDKSDAPPSSANKKRRRRSAFEIDRKFTCQIDGCVKAYGTESSLTHHQKLKHPEKLAEEAQENQVGAFFLPLHTASRNVNIRPATALLPFTSDQNLLLKSQSSDNVAASNDFVPPSAKTQRLNARFRSNSLPVASANHESDQVAVGPSSNPIRGDTSKPRAKTRKKLRRVATPKTTAKNRAKSDSFAESSFECKIPPPRNNTAIMPFNWPPSSFAAARHHSTSLSSDEQAIDSDILSVLANCDAEELSESTAVQNQSQGPPSYHSGTSFRENEDAEMLPVGMECFKIAENTTLPTDFPIKEPEAELGLNAFATLSDDWVNALHLSSHLEKMSMTPVDSVNSHDLESFSGPEKVGRLRSVSDPSFLASPMGFGVISDPFAVKTQVLTVENGQLDPNEATFQAWHPLELEISPSHQSFWQSTEVPITRNQPTSPALDELLEHDDLLDWKSTSNYEGNGEIDYGFGDVTMTSALL